MAKISNSVTLIGNVGQDPETFRFEDGGIKVKFSIATNDKYKNHAGELIEQTEWHTCIASGKLAQVVEKYVRKGSKIVIEGKLRHRKYEDNTGATRYVTEILARDMEMLDTKSASSDNTKTPKQTQNVPF